MRTLATLYIVPILCCFSLFALADEANELRVELTYQTETEPNSDRYHRLARSEAWNLAQTAVIVCDVWDSHHSINAVRRVDELSPRINQFISELRKRGATIIHAPSDCMKHYEDHLARKRASEITIRPETPQDIATWCDRIPAEEQAAYPIDQSDGGEDDDAHEHLQWLATLAAAGRNPNLPWFAQTPVIKIDDKVDFISDKGFEVWNILTDRNVKNVMLLGVHTNMCVLGRPFGLRQLSQHGFNVALVRDLTDTMYNPAAWPYINHFSGTDLIVDHVERYVCSTMTSDQVLGTEAFQFRNDNRKHLAIVMAEPEYETNRTLTKFARQHLYCDFRVSLIYGPESTQEADPQQGIPGLEAIAEADVLLLSVRRKPLPPEQLQLIRDFANAGKPIIGIRTANHAFSLRNAQPEAGLASWDSFDADVFGGNYTNHHSNDASTTVAIANADRATLFLPDLDQTKAFASFNSSGSLYKTSPLKDGTSVILSGSTDTGSSEPVSWTFMRLDGGRSFYTSLGHASDFESIEFRHLLINSIRWSVDLPSLDQANLLSHEMKYANGSGKQRK
jgi:nicotinamidase-related amidase/type 1 glutamine amidotransferase